MVVTSERVGKILDGIKYWFCGLGYRLSERDNYNVITCAHMCGGYDDDTKDEQRQKVKDMVEDGIERSGVKDVILRMEDTSTWEYKKGDTCLYHFVVELLVPKD